MTIKRALVLKQVGFAFTPQTHSLRSCFCGEPRCARRRQAHVAQSTYPKKSNRSAAFSAEPLVNRRAFPIIIRLSKFILFQSLYYILLSMSQTTRPIRRITFCNSYSVHNRIGSRVEKYYLSLSNNFQR